MAEYFSKKLKATSRVASKVPEWPFAFAIKTALLFSAGPILFITVIVVLSLLFPDSREWLRQVIDRRFIFTALFINNLAILSYLILQIRKQGKGYRDVGLKSFPVWTALKYLLAYPFVYFLVIIVAVGAITLIAQFLGHPIAAEQLAPNKRQESFYWDIAVYAVIIVPFVEELFYRGILLPAWVNKKGWLKGSIYSSLVFSLAHGPAAPFIMILSLYQSRMYYRTGSIIPGLVVHMLNNLAVTAALLR